MAGIVVCALSIPFAFYARREPVKAFAFFFFLLPVLGLFSNFFAKSHVVSLLIAPFAALVWAQFNRNRFRASLTSLPGWRWLVGFLSILTMSSVVALGRYGILFARSEPAGATAAGEPFSAVHAVAWVALYTLQHLNGILLLVILLSVLSVQENPKRIVLIWLTALSWGFLITVVFGFIQIRFNPHLGNAVGFSDSLRINGTFADPNALAFSVQLFSPLFFVLIFTMAFRWWKLALILSFLAMLIVVLLHTGTRSALLGLAVAIAFGFVLIPKSKATVGAFLGGCVLMLILAFAFRSKTPTIERLMEIVNRSSRQTRNLSLVGLFSTNRTEMWQGALTVIKKHPIVGVGSGAYLIELPRIARESNAPFTYDNAGSFYLQTWAEMGLFGLVFWIGFITVVVKNAFAAARRSQNPVWVAWPLASVMGMCVALFYGPHTIFFEVQILFWFALALALGTKSITNEQQ